VGIQNDKTRADMLSRSRATTLSHIEIPRRGKAPETDEPEITSTGQLRAVALPTPHEFRIPRRASNDRATLTLLSGIDAGQSFTLNESSIVIGRDADCEIPVDDAAVSRHHARITRSSDGIFTIEDLDSRNGTFVQARPIKRATLVEGDRVHLGPHVAFRFATTDELEDTLRRRLYETSMRDALTGAYNRFAFGERFESEIAHARRSGSPLSLMILDIDHFKSVNDEFGHLIGDQVLCAVVSRLLHCVRAEDVVARYGGDEIVILSRATDRASATLLAERLRNAVVQRDVATARGGAKVTISIGVGELAECARPTAVDLVALVDARMYAAKTRGRNRVCSGG
jgi:diguanylate cyclase (GGDEF)-like protein